MIKRKCCLFCFIILLSCILLSCDNVQVENETPKNEDTLSYLIPNFPYTLKCATSFVVRSKNLIDKYGTPDLHLNNNVYSYDIWRKGEENIVAAYEEGALLHLISYGEVLNSKDFKDIVIDNSTVDDVKKVDPFVYLLVPDDEQNIKYSEHVLEDAILTITYAYKNNDWYVANIERIENTIFDFDLINNG